MRLKTFKVLVAFKKRRLRKNIRQVFVYVKEEIINKKVTKEVLNILSEQFDLYTIQDIEAKNGSLRKVNKIPEVDLAISLGGDGTLLSLARRLDKNIPILGINLGGRGVINEVRIEDLPLIITQIKEGDFWLEERMRLKGVINGEETVKALSEIYVLRANFNVTPYFTIESNLGFKFSSRMDGIIISTPTGSTGYNFSAGGPILLESMKCMILTPVLPINYLPSIVTPSCELSIRSSDHSYVIVDGQTRYELKPDELLYIKEDEPVILIRFSRSPLRQFMKVGGFE